MLFEDKRRDFASWFWEKNTKNKKQKTKNIFLLLQKQQRSEDLYRIDGKEPTTPSMAPAFDL